MTQFAIRHSGLEPNSCEQDLSPIQSPALHTDRVAMASWALFSAPYMCGQGVDSRPRLLGGRLFAGTTHAGCDRHTKGTKLASPVGMAGATSPQVPRGSGRHSAMAGCYFHSNHSCRLRPAHQGMKMAPPSPVRVDDSSRGLDGGRFLRSRNPACAGMTDVGVLPLFSYQ